MTDTALAPDGDSTRRFLFEQADIRGEIVQLDLALREMFAVHQYPPGVGRLLGEFLAAAVLLSTTLKFRGRLVLQARSEGQVPLLMAECDHQLQIRGIARGAEQATSEQFSRLLRAGQLAITVEPLQGRPYQGIVPLEADSLAGCLDAYFEQSEQVPTCLWLAAEEQRAAGMLLQQLPSGVTADVGQRQLQWQHLCTLAASCSAGELLRLAPERLLYRLYHEDPLRLFEPRRVRFHCSCSQERSRNALSALGPAELREILAEQGSITVDCEFCNQQYRFQREQLGDLVDTADPPVLH